MTNNSSYLWKSQTFQLTSSRRGWQYHWPMAEIDVLFQLTSSRRGWPWVCFVCPLWYVFQLTSSRRGWHFHRYDELFTGYFNSHPHEEDDVTLWWIITRVRHFNSHPHEEDDRWRILQLCSGHYFNSHPHEEDDQELVRCTWCQIISTHILTKRMTKHTQSINMELRISTHILTKRMTI